MVEVDFFAGHRLRLDDLLGSLGLDNINYLAASLFAVLAK